MARWQAPGAPRGCTPGDPYSARATKAGTLFRRGAEPDDPVTRPEPQGGQADLFAGRSAEAQPVTCSRRIAEVIEIMR